MTSGTWRIVAEDALRAFPAPAALPTGVRGAHAVVEADGRRRVVVDRVWDGPAAAFTLSKPERALFQALDECALHVRLQEGRRFVHRPGGFVFVRVTGNRGPLEAWLTEVTARVVLAGSEDDTSAPPASPAAEPR